MTKTLVDRLEDIDPYDDPGAADVVMEDAARELRNALSHSPPDLPRIPPKHLKDGCYARADALEAHLNAAKAENVRLRRQLNFANREPPHCPSCNCGSDEPGVGPTIQQTGWWQCQCCQSYYTPERIVCPVSGDNRPKKSSNWHCPHCGEPHSRGAVSVHARLPVRT